MKTRMLALMAGLCLFMSTSIAQTKTSFAIRAGVNFTNINGEDMDGDDLDFKLKTGFHVGVDVDIPIATDFYIRPGAFYSTKGAKFDDDDDTKLNLSYIEIPVGFVYKPVLGAGRLILGVGPYVAFAVSGKIKNDDDEQDIEFENEIELDQIDDPVLKGFDAGGNIFFGYEFNQRFFAQLNAQLGLVNIAPKIKDVDDEDALGKYKNTGFGLSIGYRF
jgi:hypothetical protein